MSRFIVQSKSDTGQVRQKNEDNLHAESHDEYTLLIVCDGMGGHEAGEKASAIAVQSLIHSLSRAAPNNRYPDLISQALKNADQRVFEESIKSKIPSMGTTASVVLIRNNMLYVGYVGDSRVYLFRRDGKRYYQYLKTADHNHKTIAQRNDQKIPENEGNALIQAIGGGVEGVAPSTYKGFSFERGDLILVCSDGLTDMVSDQQIEQIIHQVPFEKLADELVEVANRQGGEDNISVVLLGDQETQRFVQGAQQEEKRRDEQQRQEEQRHQAEQERRENKARAQRQKEAAHHAQQKERQKEEARVRTEQHLMRERKTRQSHEKIPPDGRNHARAVHAQSKQKRDSRHSQKQPNKSNQENPPNKQNRSAKSPYQSRPKDVAPQKPANNNRMFAVVVITFGLIMAGLLMFLLSDPPENKAEKELVDVRAQYETLKQEKSDLAQNVTDLENMIRNFDHVALIQYQFDIKRNEVIEEIESKLKLTSDQACANGVIDCSSLTDPDNNPDPKDTAQNGENNDSPEDTEKSLRESKWKGAQKNLTSLINALGSIDLADEKSFGEERVIEYDAFIRGLNDNDNVKTERLERIKGCKHKPEESNTCVYDTNNGYPQEMCAFLCYLVQSQQKDE